MKTPSIRHRRLRRSVRAVCLACLACSTFALNLRAQSPTGVEPDSPSLTPAARWLLEPSPVADALAATAAEMKPYTEKIPGMDVTFQMLPIPGGTFRMGSSAGEPQRREDEGPQWEVTIEPFWMGKYEVTWDEFELWAMGLDRQYRELTGAKADQYDNLADAVSMPTKPYADMTFGMGKDGYPAICMTQLAAKMYCKWLSAKTGRLYRLPTEAEWEYACRAGTTTAYSFGDDPGSLDEYAWYFDNCDDGYQKVGRKKPNPWGLYDMHGNVAEWVLDQYAPDGYAKLAAGQGAGRLLVPTAIYPRAVRGGSWVDDPDVLRSAARGRSDPEWKRQDPQIPRSIWYYTDADFVGFRVLRPLRKPSPDEAELFDLDRAQKEAMVDYAQARGTAP
jgi:formylglycine-generating enzyme required for sulfatase activity